MNKPVGNFGFAIKKSKKSCFFSISKDGHCDDLNENDSNYLNSILSSKNNISEGVFYVALDIDVESILLNEGFVKNETRAVEVLNYMKEYGYLKTY